MSTYRRLFLALGCASWIVAAGCSDNPAAGREEIDESLIEAVRAMGLRTDMIEGHGSFLLVEGDIYLPKEQLRASPKAPPGDPLIPIPLIICLLRLPCSPTLNQETGRCLNGISRPSTNRRSS
jgi:hypothetical protein